MDARGIRTEAPAERSEEKAAGMPPAEGERSLALALGGFEEPSRRWRREPNPPLSGVVEGKKGTEYPER
jgi:hypothetical protein